MKQLGRFECWSSAASFDRRAQLPPFTVSLGITDMMASNDLGELIHFADQALMKAKSEGRDRVVVWDPTISGEQADLLPGSANDLKRDSGERFEMPEIPPSEPPGSAAPTASAPSARR